MFGLPRAKKQALINSLAGLYGQDLQASIIWAEQDGHHTNLAFQAVVNEGSQSAGFLSCLTIMVSDQEWLNITQAAADQALKAFDIQLRLVHATN